MATISTERKIVTLINVFTVAPERQQELVDLLVEATEKVMNKQPGYISANFHKSLDGTKVTNYAQWQSREAFEAALSKPEVRAHTEKAGAIATNVEPHLYTVVYTDGDRS